MAGGERRSPPSSSSVTSRWRGRKGCRVGCERVPPGRRRTSRRRRRRRTAGCRQRQRIECRPCGGGGKRQTGWVVPIIRIRRKRNASVVQRRWGRGRLVRGARKTGPRAVQLRQSVCGTGVQGRRRKQPRGEPRRPHREGLCQRQRGPCRRERAFPSRTGGRHPSAGDGRRPTREPQILWRGCRAARWSSQDGGVPTPKSGGVPLVVAHRRQGQRVAGPPIVSHGPSTPHSLRRGEGEGRGGRTHAIGLCGAVLRCVPPRPVARSSSATTVLLLPALSPCENGTRGKRRRQEDGVVRCHRLLWWGWWRWWGR